MLIAAGANLPSPVGAPEKTVDFALARLAERGHVIRAVSRYFRTPCFPAGAGPDYVNAALVLDTDAAPAELLADLHRVEAECARERIQRWGMRTLDLDLLADGDRVLPDAQTQARWRDLDPAEQRRQAPDRLILPHPRIQDRAFVLVPLADIAPGWRHPGLGLTVQQMLGRLAPEDVAAVVPITRTPAD
jgi:2-amino-4-hydroxy-6-hydroxymethyldihydropteridine diphosphokinase